LRLRGLFAFSAPAAAAIGHLSMKTFDRPASRMDEEERQQAMGKADQPSADQAQAITGGNGAMLAIGFADARRVIGKGVGQRSAFLLCKDRP
jgi:hypothetical protein